MASEHGIYVIAIDEDEALSTAFHGGQEFDTFAKANACLAAYPDTMRSDFRVFRLTIAPVPACHESTVSNLTVTRTTD